MAMGLFSYGSPSSSLPLSLPRPHTTYYHITAIRTKRKTLRHVEAILLK